MQWHGFILVLTTIVLPLCRQYIFKRQDYNKPFFSTFTKTSMFVIYLLGFLLWRPWRQQCTGSIKRQHAAFVSVRAEQTIATRGHCASRDALNLECRVFKAFLWTLTAFYPFLTPAPLHQPPATFPNLQFADANAYLAPCTTEATGNNCLVWAAVAVNIFAFSSSQTVSSFDPDKNVYCFTSKHLSLLCKLRSANLKKKRRNQAVVYHLSPPPLYLGVKVVDNAPDLKSYNSV